MSLEIELKILDKRYQDGTWELPKYETDGSAALDLRATSRLDLLPGKCALMPTGISIHIKNPGYVEIGRASCRERV
jgi:dUTP pyrophosphatase